MSSFSTVGLSFLMPQHLRHDRLRKTPRLLFIWLSRNVTEWLQYAVLETAKYFPWYLKIDNSAVRQYFQIKFCAYFTEYFRIKHTRFTQDAFRFHISVVHCVGFTFFRTQCIWVCCHNSSLSRLTSTFEYNKSFSKTRELNSFFVFLLIYVFPYVLFS